MVIEFVAGILFNSLALLSDAAHRATDVVGLGMALAAIQLAAHRRSTQRTYGLYRWRRPRRWGGRRAGSERRFWCPLLAISSCHHVP